MIEYLNEQAARAAAESAATEIRKVLTSYGAEIDIDHLTESVRLYTYYGDPGEGEYIEVHI